MTGERLWSGRFSKPPAKEVHDFSSSLSFDQRMWREDIDATLAHARALQRAGILTNGELKQIGDALAEASRLLEAGSFEFHETDEDIHSAIERFLIDRLSETGAKIHAGRSRNDLVVTDFRLWLKRRIPLIARGLHDLEQAIVGQARAHASTLAPGYTHLQRAQPIVLAHHLLAHAFALARDFERLVASYARVDVSPLGASAFAGTTLPIDALEVAADLGFAKAFDNSADAVSDRDFALEFLSSAAIASVHLSRLGEEVVLWTSAEFGFARLDDAYSTGSSIMPNKKNPDVAELARAKAARISSNLQHLLGVMKGLPLAYDRDLQEDKEPVFDTVDTLFGVIHSMKGMIETIEFDRERLAEAVSSGDAGATDLAEWLVLKGVPFREAHESVGKLVAGLSESGRELRSATIDDLRSVHSTFEVEALDLLDPRVSIATRSSHGGTSPERIAEQFIRLDEVLEQQRVWIEGVK